MARKVERITITDEGRDKGKVFVLTEMAADKAERWAIRALLALTNSGVDIPADAANAGMAGIAAAGFEALGRIKFEDVEPLLDEMFECVQHEPRPGVCMPIIKGEGSQIEEIKTRFRLRKELFRLHTGFFSDAAPQT
jgi:hypothetical protein